MHPNPFSPRNILLKTHAGIGRICLGTGVAPRHCASPSTRRARLVVPRSGQPDKVLESMRRFSEQYARNTGTYFCADKSVPAVVIKGLAEHKRKYGSPLCPCRHYDDKAAEVAQGFWNCPCVPMRERHECHCMLFLTPDNEFRGDDQTISREEIDEVARTEES